MAETPATAPLAVEFVGDAFPVGEDVEQPADAAEPAETPEPVETPEPIATSEPVEDSEPVETPSEGVALPPDEADAPTADGPAADESEADRSEGDAREVDEPEAPFEVEGAPATEAPDADADADEDFDGDSGTPDDAGADVEASVEADAEAGVGSDPVAPLDPLGPVDPAGPEDPAGTEDPADPAGSDSTDVAPEADADPAPDVELTPDADAVESETEPVPALIGWVTQDGKLYYYGSDGTALLGERYLDGAWYYFDPLRGGAAATGFARVPIAAGSGSFKTSYFDASGKRVAGLQTIGSDRYFFDDDGALTLGFVEFGDDVDYFDPDDGALQTGQQYIHGDWRNFEDDGAMSTGFTTVSDGGSGVKTVYYDEFDGAMQYGEQPIDGSWYLFDASTGAMQTGWQWVESGNKIAYYGADGRRYSGECVIDGYRRYFDPATGAVDKYGFQNPLGYYQVSSQNVSLPSWQYATGFGYVTPSRIDVAATREDCVDAFIARAYEYVGTPYIWDYALAPGVGVDCAGLVLQCLYATGMDMGWYTPYDHYYTPGHDQYANAMASDSKFMHVSFADRQRGDLIFYKGHVGIYLGNDQIIDAFPDGRGVQVRNLWHMTPNYIVARPFV